MAATKPPEPQESTRVPGTWPFYVALLWAWFQPVSAGPTSCRGYLKRSWCTICSRKTGNSEGVGGIPGSLPFPVLGMPGSLGTVTRTLFLFLLVPGWVCTALQQLCLGTAASCFDACKGFGLRDSCSQVSEGSWAGSRMMQTCWVIKPR